jgi:hypothetical protein
MKSNGLVSKQCSQAITNVEAQLIARPDDYLKKKPGPKKQH